MANFLGGEYTVYRLFTERGDYFGMTKNLVKRLANHRGGGRMQDHPYYGFEIIKTNLSYEDAREIEDLLITSLPSINERRSGLIIKDMKAYCKLQYGKHKESRMLKAKVRSLRLHEGELMMFGKTHMVTARKILNGELVSR